MHDAHPVTDAEAGRAAEALVRCGFFNGSHRTAGLRRVGDAYHFRAPVAPAGAEDDPVVAEDARQVAGLLSRDALGGAPVEVHLCDTDFRTVWVVTP